MVSQVILSSETLVTNVTFEWPFISVNSLLKFCKIFISDFESERSWNPAVDGLKYLNWKVIRDEIRRCQQFTVYYRPEPFTFIRMTVWFCFGPFILKLTMQIFLVNIQIITFRKMSLAVLTNEFSFLFSASIFWHLFIFLWISIFFAVGCRLCKSVKIESILMSLSLISQQFMSACLLLIALICCSNWMSSWLFDASCLSIGRRTLITFTGVIILREILCYQ